MDAVGEGDVEMSDRRSSGQYNFFDGILPSEPFTPHTQDFVNFRNFAGPYVSNGSLFDSEIQKTSGNRYENYENMIHQKFPSENDLCNFFENVQILFPYFQKRYVFKDEGRVQWSMWYHENSKSVCFLSMHNDDNFNVPYNSVRYNPVNRIRLKKKKAENSDEATELEKEMMEGIIPTTPSSVGKHQWRFEMVGDNEEKVEYFENNRLISAGLPKRLVDILFSKIYSSMLKFIYSEKSASTVGKSGILSFFLKCLFHIPEKRREDSLFVDATEDSNGNSLIYSLGHQFNLGGTPFNNGNPILIIYEKVEQESLYTDGDIETVQIIKYKLTFAKDFFPENPKLINVESVEMVEPGERQMVTRELSPDSLKKNFLSDRNSSTTMVNFLEYFLHKYLVYWGIQTNYDIAPQDHYAPIGCFYHPLAMEKVPWELLSHYITTFQTLPTNQYVQVGVLKDDLSMGDAVDVGGPSRTFIEQMARQLFRCQEKRLLLHSLAHPINHNFSSRISMYSPEILFPVYYHVNTFFAKQDVAYKILLFLRQVDVMDEKLPPVIDPLFFYYFLECKNSFYNRELVDFLNWEFLHDTKERKRIIQSTEPNKFNVKTSEPFVHYYHHILIDLVIRVHEKDVDSEKNPVLYFALFLRNYFVPKKNPSNLNECFRFVLGDFWSERAKRVSFYNDMQTVFEKYFELQLWSYEPCTNATFPDEEEDNVDDELDRMRFFYLQTKYNADFRDKKRLSLPKGNEVFFVAQKLIQVLKESYDPIVEFIYYCREKYDALPHIFEEHMDWDKHFGLGADRSMHGLADWLIGSTSRELVAQGIVYEGDSVAPPLVSQKIEWLKEHILDPLTSQEWVDGFLRAVTGTSTFSEEIRVNPVRFDSNRYCTAHTCFNVLDVSSNSNECPGVPEDVRRQMSEKQVFIKNLTDGLLAAQNHALLA